MVKCSRCGREITRYPFLPRANETLCDSCIENDMWANKDSLDLF